MSALPDCVSQICSRFSTSVRNAGGSVRPRTSLRIYLMPAWQNGRIKSQIIQKIFDNTRLRHSQGYAQARTVKPLSSMALIGVAIRHGIVM